VQCGEQIGKTIEVEVPRDGRITIKKTSRSDLGLDSWIKVENKFNQEMNYWYRCGVDGKMFYNS